MHRTVGSLCSRLLPGIDIDRQVFTLNLEQMLSGAPLDAAIGVLQVTVRSARSLKGVKIGGGRPDPYVALSISQRAVLAETSHKENTYAVGFHSLVSQTDKRMLDTIRRGTRPSSFSSIL
jgi:Ca2+-dependent lipid-binding protein